MIVDCLSHIVCQNIAEDDETLNSHVTALMMFQDGKLQDIRHQTLLDPQLVKLARVIKNGWGESCGELEDPDLHTFWIHRFNMHIANGIIITVPEMSCHILYNKNIYNAYIWDIKVSANAEPRQLYFGQTLIET